MKIYVICVHLKNHEPALIFLYRTKREIEYGNHFRSYCLKSDLDALRITFDLASMAPDLISDCKRSVKWYWNGKSRWLEDIIVDIWSTVKWTEPE